ncbi:DMT family transporter [Allokutzneria sp. A3M-2-11 16]|uniref:EamA family transporter n=1 Tax=Allokutzneria sp. A3M-2-11 16 TaxID=2962043 RepID=UPI0020B80C10|nr:EamA family transporter [Allokutzneria sp. A3M-2-11 16]MCP3805440.1 DMT family transporter [Allokutzneria sp. A3M-2-11 16]
MGTLLALASAVGYGVADFAGGLLSRRIPFATVAFLGQLGGVLLAAIALVTPGSPSTVDILWGGLSGVGTGVGMLFLFRGLSRGAMSVVVPTSAVGGMVLPVLVGVALLGERPSLLSWLGIAVAVPALWLVSASGGADNAVSDGLIASVGIATQYLALAQASPDAGLWPVFAGRVTGLLTVAPLLIATRQIPRPRSALACCAAGAAAGLALVLFRLAAERELVAIAVVLSSLYPVIPVLLGITALRERLSRRQALGLLGAAIAIPLLAHP